MIDNKLVSLDDYFLLGLIIGLSFQRPGQSDDGIIPKNRIYFLFTEP